MSFVRQHKGAVVWSLALHVAVVAAVAIGLPWRIERPRVPSPPRRRFEGVIIDQAAIERERAARDEAARAGARSGSNARSGSAARRPSSSASPSSASSSAWPTRSARATKPRARKRSASPPRRPSSSGATSRARAEREAQAKREREEADKRRASRPSSAAGSRPRRAPGAGRARGRGERRARSRAARSVHPHDREQDRAGTGIARCRRSRASIASSESCKLPTGDVMSATVATLQRRRSRAPLDRARRHGRVAAAEAAGSVAVRAQLERQLSGPKSERPARVFRQRPVWES